MSFGIQYQTLSGRINIGRINKAGTAFLGGKEDRTGAAIWAVGEWLIAHDDGGEWYEITNKKGVTMRLKAEIIPQLKEERS